MCWKMGQPDVFLCFTLMTVVIVTISWGGYNSFIAFINEISSLSANLKPVF